MMNKLWNRARERREGDEGFTLVELLVVIVIIGILVAIAIPVFLSQREKGWAASVQSDLRNGSPIAETFYADNGTYVGLLTTGMNHGADNTLEAKGLTVTSYCLEGKSSKLTGAGDVWSFHSTTGLVTKTAC